MEQNSSRPEDFRVAKEYLQENIDEVNSVKPMLLLEIDGDKDDAYQD